MGYREYLQKYNGIFVNIFIRFKVDKNNITWYYYIKKMIFF